MGAEQKFVEDFYPIEKSHARRMNALKDEMDKAQKERELNRYRVIENREIIYKILKMKNPTLPEHTAWGAKEGNMSQVVALLGTIGTWKGSALALITLLAALRLHL